MTISDYQIFLRQQRANLNVEEEDDEEIWYRSSLDTVCELQWH